MERAAGPMFNDGEDRAEAGRLLACHSGFAIHSANTPFDSVTIHNGAPFESKNRSHTTN
jgi:hypothetical protein